MLKRCLESLSAQRNAPAFEVIVVDNGSSDGSVEWLDEMRGLLTFSLRIIKNTENRGFCGANNQGIAKSRGEWVALLNNDAEARPGWIAGMWDAVRSRPAYGMVACKILVYEDPRKIDKAGHLIYPDGQNRGRGSGQADRGQFDVVEDVLWPDGCAAMYRKSMLDAIGAFDEDLFAYGDDAELGLRARIAGWECVYTPSAVVLHHRGSTLGLFSARRLELIERNRILLAVRHFPLSLLCVNGFYWITRMGAGAWAALHGRGEAGRFQGMGGKWKIAMALLRGSLQAIPMLPSTLRKRRDARGIRKLTPRQTKELLFRYRITLKELSEQAI